MRSFGIKRAGWRRYLAVVALAVAGALVVPGIAAAHLERPSYWPDPGPDTSVRPPAGGAVPEMRNLRSALRPRSRGRTRVVCKGPNANRSMRFLNRSLRQARRKGFRLRPSQSVIRYRPKRAKSLRRINRRLANRCKFNSVQPAINRSGNNDRVVIMPGRYVEKRARDMPVNDPRCADMTQTDGRGRQAPSYEYQVNCPHDQNLIYVQGREIGDTPPPDPPLEDRHGIPDLGECVRCNLQIEGSGVKPEDVILDAGTDYEPLGQVTASRRQTAMTPRSKPGGYAKDVVLRVDRADGFVGRNFLVRGAEEHGFYTEETDGALLDRVKFFWNRDYGHLSFHTDHHVIRNCHGFGSGDAVVYPGASPETGSQARSDFYPDAPRFNTVVRRCDMHHSVLAYSGSMGNAVRITDNHVYATGSGISTDSISVGGHPGFPSDSVQIDNNLIYSNNLNLYTDDPPVDPLVGLLPVGVGVFWAGHNDGVVRDNWIFDNWRRGTMLFAIPDALVIADVEGEVNDGISCPTPDQSTSCGNRFFNNNMGVAPPGFEMPPGVRMLGNPVGGDGGVLPNGLDFWWDPWAGNTGNCWFDNTGPDGTADSVSGSGPLVGGLPADCDTSVGMGNPEQTGELLACFIGREGDVDAACTWGETPPQPQTAAARQQERDRAREAREFARSEEGRRLAERIDELTAGDGG
jgi:hypothetical protein